MTERPVIVAFNRLDWMRSYGTAVYSEEFAPFFMGHEDYRVAVTRCPDWLLKPVAEHDMECCCSGCRPKRYAEFLEACAEMNRRRLEEEKANDLR